MKALSPNLRKQLERTVVQARDVAEAGARAALEALAVHHHEPYGHMSSEQRNLRRRLRAHARLLGDRLAARLGSHGIDHLVHECAYEHWHGMLFARFLAENHLLIEPEMGVAITLDECEELAKEVAPALPAPATLVHPCTSVAPGVLPPATLVRPCTSERIDKWALAARFAHYMLPQVFRPDHPVFEAQLAREHRLKLERQVEDLPVDVFTATDSLGWVYQFWQTKKKDEVNAAGNKIGANELPPVTQLFTEDYMVDFLLDNTLGAWHAGKVLAATPRLAENARSEDELRQAVALPGCPWKYLRFIQGKDDEQEVRNADFVGAKIGRQWAPAAGTFDGWPKTAKELTCLDPCMGSGHFVVAMFERLVALRLAEETLDEAAAVEAVIRDNLFGLEIDPRCTQIGAFNLALAAWRRVGHRPLPAMNLACSGLAPNTREADWLAIAGKNEKLKNGMERLYRLFKDAPTLGSLINPRAGESDLFVAAFHELQPLLEKALAPETKDDTAHDLSAEASAKAEMAVTARGLAKAAEILAGQFTLVATNVPYLGRKKHDDVLKDYCERVYPDSKTDLATCFLERSLTFCALDGSIALVTPQNWLSLGGYEELRKHLLRNGQWEFVARLGPKGFQTPMYDFNVLLIGLTNRAASASHFFSGFDVSELRTPAEKDTAFRAQSIVRLNQKSQLANPDSRVSTSEMASGGTALGEHVECYQGVVTGDLERFRIQFWEVNHHADIWRPFRTTTSTTGKYDGLDAALRWEGGKGQLHEYAALTRDQLHDMHESGNRAWNKLGVAINRMAELRVTSYLGEIFDNNVAVIIPKKPSQMSALLTFCSAPEFHDLVRSLDQTLKVTNRTLVKVPFDLAHWQKVAAEKYPHGLPKPFSSDPTQWLFNGHPKGSDQPLHATAARLLGYQWPRQTCSSFPDCPALGSDGLGKHGDADGIACLPSVRGERPAHERLLHLLEAAWGDEWSNDTLSKLLAEAGSNRLDDWLRNQFFELHCKLFHQRPFIWHIWDGRKNDGFHALVNYHKLAEGNGKGRRLLESLTYSYLGDWISRQQDGVKRGEGGAEDRLAAALELQKRLVAIIEGEPPFDLFVRWKPIEEQPIGWEPDINDGVRLNIRPFMAQDLPGGKTGAGILRAKPNVHWKKDRGKEPMRDQAQFPWFWNNGKFIGERVNDVHQTNDEKQKARERAEGGQP